MKALVLNQSTFQIEEKVVNKPKISSHDVLIQLKSCAINHHELWSLQEKSIKSKEDIILGSDGSGIIEEVGTQVSHFKKGDEVVINPSLNWGQNPYVQAENYEILGYPTQGTFAEYISVDQRYVYLKPDHLSFHEAAAFPLAGLTAYRALFTKGKIASDHKVLITGIGGGVALFALNYAKALGAEVYITSGSNEKIKKATALGAKEGVNYTTPDWKTDLSKQLEGFDVIVDSAGGKGFVDLMDLAKPGGRIVLFGRTAGNIPKVSPKTIFWKQLSILGTTMGTDEEFKEMVGFIESKLIKPVIDTVYKPREINLAFKRMEEGKQFGKIVLDLEKF